MYVSVILEKLLEEHMTNGINSDFWGYGIWSDLPHPAFMHWVSVLGEEEQYSLLWRIS